MTQEPALLAEDIVFAYGDKDILDIGSFALGSGEIVAIVGKSGCGKSTFLKLLAGELKARDGARIVSREAPAYLAQGDTSFRWLTVRQNIEFPLRRRGMSREKASERSSELLNLVELSAAADVYPDALSGGMRQRMLLARTLAPSPEIVLLDEPFGALDLITRQSIESGILRLASTSSESSMIVVTHDIDNALSLADRIFVLAGEPAHFVDVVSNDVKGRDPYSSRVLNIIDKIR